MLVLLMASVNQDWSCYVSVFPLLGFGFRFLGNRRKKELEGSDIMYSIKILGKTVLDVGCRFCIISSVLD